MSIPRLGVYIASYNQPVFLRHALLQLSIQTRLPDVIAIHENAHVKDYRWAYEDVQRLLEARGVEVLFLHTPRILPMPAFFRVPLAMLIEAGCDLFMKLDHDDIIYSDHIAVMEEAIRNMDMLSSSYDQAVVHFAMNVNSSVLVLTSSKGSDGHSGYEYKPSIDFGIWNPTGAHPNCIIFDRDLAQVYLQALYQTTNIDDVVLTGVLRVFHGRKLNLPPTNCYVAHGKNVTTAHWSDQPPVEVR